MIHIYKNLNKVNSIEEIETNTEILHTQKVLKPKPTVYLQSKCKSQACHGWVQVIPTDQNEKTRDEGHTGADQIQPQGEPTTGCLEQEQGHRVAVQELTLSGNKRDQGKRFIGFFFFSL